MREVAIVGGGPAGAMCGARLAEAGFSVTIFDDRMAWEKPCGGGLTYKAIERYPFLLDSPHPKTIARQAELIASDGTRAEIELKKPVVLYSRKVLNGLLLERARRAGCKTVCARVTRAHICDSGARFHVNGDSHSADFLVVAAGARNSLLPETAPLAPQDLEMTVGYFLPAGGNGDSANGDLIKVQFLENLTGYLWSFPRPGHFSVGICAPLAQQSSRSLLQRVQDFLRREFIADAKDGHASNEATVAPATIFSHVLPAPRAETLRQRRIVGRAWALVGDAAALVDPLTGEGLYYALRSGDLLAQALIHENPEDYPALLRQEFQSELETAGRVARRFYRGTFLGGQFHLRMVQLLRRSAVLREIAGNLFAGSQDYSSLKKRLRSRAGTVALQLLASLWQR
ncbi:MAG TPA: NAD(P)/FAD-dependent oxidoreductase [Candidatus Nitrosotenuis sp.]|nr:NAD(P)/FAD-dependent oxidoreductase [Candidatus Nitrosotenuis sp.]